MTRERPIDVVLREHAEELISLPGVVGTAHGEDAGEPCVEVFVATRDRGLLTRIPAVLEGYRVVIKQTGEIRALRQSTPS